MLLLQPMLREKRRGCLIIKVYRQVLIITGDERIVEHDSRKGAAEHFMRLLRARPSSLSTLS